MSKKLTILILISISLLVFGGLIFFLAMSSIGWDFTKLSTRRLVNNEYEITENFKNINIATTEGVIEIIPSTDGKTKVVLAEKEKTLHNVFVSQETLNIEMNDERKWYDHVGINWETQKVKLYIPSGEYDALDISTDTGDIDIAKDYFFEKINIKGSTVDVVVKASVLNEAKIETSTGDINLENLTAGSIDISVTTGSVELENVKVATDLKIKVETGECELDTVTCKNLISTGSTGDISLESVIATGYFNITRSTGDVEFERSDASEITIETSTGDVKGSLLSEKVFIVDTDTGRKRVPESVSGGRCKVTTDTGDVIITIAK